MRLLTVFSDAPVSSAMSRKGRSAISRSKNTSRWSSGSASTAFTIDACTSDAAAERSALDDGC